MLFTGLVKIDYPYDPVSYDYVPFCIQSMKVVQGTKSSVWKCNILIEYIIKHIQYSIIKIYHAIYVNFS